MKFGTPNSSVHFNGRLNTNTISFDFHNFILFPNLSKIPGFSNTRTIRSEVKRFNRMSNSYTCTLYFYARTSNSGTRLDVLKYLEEISLK